MKTFASVKGSYMLFFHINKNLDVCVPVRVLSDVL